MVERCAIFIDGGYLTKCLKEVFGEPKIDYQQLSDMLADGYGVLRTYFYNCMPYKSRENPSPADIARYTNAQNFYDALRMLPSYEVRLGRLELRGYSKESKPIFQQKRVDIQLGCDLVLLSSKQRISKAILLTGDSDFIPAVEIAKNEGVEIELAYVQSARTMPHLNLRQLADKRREISQLDIDMISIRRQP